MGNLRVSAHRPHKVSIGLILTVWLCPFCWGALLAVQEPVHSTAPEPVIAKTANHGPHPVQLLSSCSQEFLILMWAGLSSVIYPPSLQTALQTARLCMNMPA
uniref:Uncharacterized protein n=1 Tax=Eutreptiella gymnastica TaxID=73025 RepID=A0A7S4GDS6_9EUGL